MHKITDITIPLFTTVCSDGIGDLIHLWDIYQALTNNKKLNHFRFVPFISCYEDHYERVLNKLKTLDFHEYYFGQTIQEEAFETSYYKDGKLVNLSVIENKENIQRLFSEAPQVIAVSSGDTFGTYEKLMNQDVVFIDILEHENQFSTRLYSVKKDNYFKHNMGLYQGVGIKISPMPSVTDKECLKTLFTENFELGTQIISNTENKSLDEFFKDNLIIPSYFNDKKAPVFRNFLLTLALNQHLITKNLLFVLSSRDIKKFVTELCEERFDELQNYNIKDIELISPSGEFFSREITESEKTRAFLENRMPIQPEIIKTGLSYTRKISINPNGCRTLKLFCGYSMNDKAFSAIFKLAFMVGVSGDTSFEMAVSQEKLPFYYSTNSGNGKLLTLKAIQDLISSNKITLDEQVKNDFLLYLDINELDNVAEPDRYTPQRQIKLSREKFSRLNFPNMAKAWETIAQYLRKHHNLYDKLEGVVLDKLPANVDKTRTHESSNLITLSSIIKKQLTTDNFCQEQSSFSPSDSEKAPKSPTFSS